MSNLAIKVNDISKLYRLGVKDQVNDSLGAAFLDFIKSPLKNYRKYRSLYKFDDVHEAGNSADGGLSDVLWALNGVSFEVQKGEVVGIIGTNGAGKSTLLKVLSRITPPTRGTVEIQGRVSSLLEVGTGFHPELTGRENVYLNGTILGMRKKEIDNKFDEIVEFSGVEKFLDTPVKRYSSGMRVRLAFAVAAHLEPEILIIDEVLAVGDAEFQKKCLNKMQEVGKEGRTVLFVSHSMPAVTRLCERVILLDQGKVMKDGTAEEIVTAYLHAGEGISAKRQWTDPEKRPGDDTVRLRSARVKNRQGECKEGLDIRQEIGIEMEFEVLEDGHYMLPYYTLVNEHGVNAFSAIDRDPTWESKQCAKGIYRSIAWIPGNLLSEGTYYLTVALRKLHSKQSHPGKKCHFIEKEAVAFNVIDASGTDSARGTFEGRMEGVVRPILNWETITESPLGTIEVETEVSGRP
jgi:lipopolysaccharide transport system ATP-binding protein